MSNNFPNGFKDSVVIRGIPLTVSHPGKVFWVGNAAAAALTGHKTASDGNRGTFHEPFSTLDYAISQCTASRGDIIMVKPGHAEAVSSATALALDVAGIAIIGLGAGTLRPTFTFDTATTATIAVSAANVSLYNLVFTANFADIVSVFTLTTAKDLTLDNCVFKATATNMNFLHVIDTNTTDNAADRLVVNKCRWVDPDAATLAFALVDASQDGWEVRSNYMNVGGTTTAAIFANCATGKILTNAIIEDNILIKAGQTDGSAGIIVAGDGTTHTGLLRRNYTANTDDAGNLHVIATSGFSMGPDNYHTGNENEHGVVLSTVFNNS